MCKLRKNVFLPDKVGHGPLGVLRVLNTGGFSGFDAVQQPGHVAAQLLHHGTALGVLQDLLGVGAMHHGPVGAVHQRHVEELRDICRPRRQGGP